ncbi:OmpP1/FadL family transporter [Burkholderia anthina]|uniref:OmpP1/FadL family transporter n=1 Tax=Burkholderia anthina TaxID=179879 RepID=UPI00158875D3|nr:outer membrane protein transport protein [Burkholderia anthina]
MRSHRLGGAFVFTVGSLLLIHCKASYALDGTELTAYGAKAAGMGGTSIALPQDSVAAANNPAGMALVGNRVDLGLQFVRNSLNLNYATPGNELQSRVIAPIPEGGFNMQISPNATFGVSLYGIGLAADYKQPVLPNMALRNAEASLQMAVAAPTVTYRISPNAYIGISALLAYQLFKAQGVVEPTATGGLAALPNHGTRSAFGYGAKLGWLWQPSPIVTVGATFATKIYTSPLSGYGNDLLNYSGGKIEAPMQFGVGVSVRPLPDLVLAADYLHLNWRSTSLGAASAFNWKNQDVFRFGAAYDINRKWTVRGGVSLANCVIGSGDVAPNFLSGGVNSNSISAGVTYHFDNKVELSAAYEYELPVGISGSGRSSGFDLETRTHVLSVSVGMPF